jgi:polyferredoxin
MPKDHTILRRGLKPNLYFITLLYFALGFVSIYFGLLALLCMFLPFVILSHYGEKRWCHQYCPRASLITLTGKTRRRWRKLPRSWYDGYAKKIMLWYLGLNLLFITGSTIQVGIGAMNPMPYIRLFVGIPLWPLPQLISATGPDWLLHLSYRFYSMMLSTTLLGVAFSFIWRPRAWCAVCPVGTLSNKLTPPRI